MSTQATHFVRLAVTNSQNLLARTRAIHELSCSQAEIITSIPETRKDPLFHFQSHRLLPSFSDVPSLTTILRHRKVPLDDMFRAGLCPVLTRPIPTHSNFSHFSGYHRSRVQITYNTTIMGTDNCLVIQGSEIRNLGDSIKIMPQFGIRSRNISETQSFYQ
jgi:hypothetical protein